MTNDAQGDMGIVYFIQGDITRRIKIGFTRNLSKRMEDYRWAGAESITLLATARGDERMERALHAAFGRYRVRGEWFEPHEELNAMIRSLAGIKLSTRPRRRKLVRRIQEELREPMTIADLAGRLDVPPTVVGVILRRYPNVFTTQGTAPILGRGQPAKLWARLETAA